MSDSKQNCVVDVTPELSRHFAVMSFVSATLIVALHSLSADKAGIVGRAFHSVIAGGICQTAIPWFFFAAGFFLAGHIGEPNWWKIAIRKRVRTLLVPFWIWSLVTCMIYIAFAVIVRWIGYDYHGVDGMSLLSWSGMLKVLGLDYFDTMPTMWFLRTLFFFVVLSPFLSRLNLLGLVVLFALSCCFDIIPEKGRVVTQLGHNLFSVRGLFYFALGLRIRMKNDYCHIRIAWRPLIAVVGIAFCILRVWSELSGFRQVATFLNAFQLPCLTYCIYYVCASRCIDKKWTSLSFPLYVTHNNIVLIITAFYGVIGIGGSGNLTIIKGLIRFAVSFALSIALCSFLRRVFPVVSKVMFGGR